MAVNIDFYDKYDFKRGVTQASISGESKIIPSSSSYEIRLNHIPRDNNSVSISGSSTTWNEVKDTTPNSTGEYRVYYNEGLGRVEFYSGDSGKSITVDYDCCGTVIYAGKDYLDGREGIGDIQQSIIDVDSNAQEYVNTHESKSNPHSSSVSDTDLNNHEGSTTGIHGVGSSVVASRDWVTNNASVPNADNADNADTIDSVHLGNIDWNHVAMSTVDVSKSDVGLGNVDNYSRSYYDGRYLLESGDVLEGNLNFNHNEALNLVIDNRTSDPASPVTGQVWIRTDLI